MLVSRCCNIMQLSSVSNAKMSKQLKKKPVLFDFESYLSKQLCYFYTWR